MLKKIYDFFISHAQKPHALFFLGIISFFGSIFSPFPSEMLLIPICLTVPKNSFRAAFVASFWSVLGGIAGYAVGRWFFVLLGTPILNSLNLMPVFNEIANIYAQWDALFIFISGLTPFPYKVIALFSGMVQTQPVVFIMASIISRFLRFYLIAWLLFKYGEKARTFIEKRLEFFFILGCILLGIIIYWMS
ncbi:MAG: DedA family protein [Alphaproteobacteria bacterium]|nr:DedA family protein [Alphaproteobacteria bacterium]